MELSKAKQGIYSQLSRRKMRDRHGLFIAEGRKSIEDTIGSFEVEAIVSTNPESIPEEWGCRNVSFVVSQGQMGKISSLSTPSDILAVYRIPDGYYDNVPEPAPDKLYLLLDGVQDPGNLGTIIRTAHWFGIDRIYASKDTVDIFNPKTVQSTMGSLGRVEVVYCDLCRLLNDNPEIPVYGTLLNGDNIYEASLSASGFIIMGNEGKGISAPIRNMVTSPLLIPPYDSGNHSESLNVAVATAVVLSQFRGCLNGGLKWGGIGRDGAGWG
ncbi:RNA methyltransferase [Sangeribacter muris]|uniref:RNA methyltransferase n=1 Tax=Sangeribacter muris TaxID=2880703 RepID=UPI00244E45E4|nr:RNA methyltransferase [Sangeribacter muris]